MFIYNKYHNWYFSIIEKAKSQNRQKYRDIYYENHHIFPAKLYPEYSNLRIHKWNSILLTAREHFICHWLLTKFIEGPGKYKMLHALSSMARNKEQRKLTSKQYEICKKANSLAKIGKKLSEETKKKMRKPKIETHHKNVSKGLTGLKKSKEHILKMSESQKGKKLSKETKKKISDSIKNNLPSSCWKKGYEHPFYGIQRTEEDKQKISKGKLGKKRLDLINNPKNGKPIKVEINGILYDSVSKASKILGLHPSKIKKIGKYL